jgi:hypothetical protein
MVESDCTIGVIQLNTNFPRPIGDIGNPKTFPFQSIIKKLDLASVADVVSTEVISGNRLAEMVDVACDLESQGCDLITTSCGFLGPVQTEVQRHLKVPFLSTSLLLLPFLRRLYPNRGDIGVLTFDARALRPHHFVDHEMSDLEILGLETDTELYRVISNDESELHTETALREVVDRAQQLVNKRGVRCIIFECTNLSPYKATVRAETGIAVFDLVDLVSFHVNALKGE